MRSTIKRLILGGASLMGTSTLLLGQAPFGQWDFDSGNLDATVGGAPLQYSATAATTGFGTTTALGIPNIGADVANVMRFPKVGVGQGYVMPVPTTANGDPFASTVNTWTLVMDILFPEASSGKKRGILEIADETLAPGAEDVEIYIGADNGIGYNDQTGGSIQPNTWHRIGVVSHFEEREIRLYVDGAEVLVVPLPDNPDGKWALDTFSGFALLFTDNDDETELGYVNSIQLRNIALSRGQMVALGGPSAAGIPQAVPQVPSFIQNWIPTSSPAGRNTPVGVVINDGDTTIADDSIKLFLDDAEIGRSIERAGDLITVTGTGVGPFAPTTSHTIRLEYTDSKDGAKVRSFEFEVALFVENFDSLVLGPNVDEATAGAMVWTKTAPTGWSIDDTGVPGVGNGETDGVTEWAGWSFADRLWWVQAAGDQDRSLFTKGTGVVAITDPDEWDDLPWTPAFEGDWYDTYLSTPSIDLTGVAAGSAFLQFDSSWRPEFDDDFHQSANLVVSFDGGEPVELFRWLSDEASPLFKDYAVNETVILPLNNPAGATGMVLTFGMFDAGNDWWWAIDNIVVNAGTAPPSVSQEPGNQVVDVGGSAVFSVGAEGELLSYQWFKGAGEAKTAIDGATSAQLEISNVSEADAGVYSVVVSNSAGSASSAEVQLIVLPAFEGEITSDLVVHLTFDGNLDDSSGKGNNASVGRGEVTYGDGAIGQAVGANFDGSNYITLGQPADLDFGTDVSFSVSFWTKFSVFASDPAFLSNKDWGGGGNPGWVIATAGDGRVQWNIGPDRRDYDGPAGTVSDGAWHHVVVTFIRGVAAITVVDGEVADARPFTGSRDVTTSDDGLSTNIGEDGTGNYNGAEGPRFNDGMFDDIGIWRRALTKAEAAAIYQAGLAGKNLSEAVVSEGGPLVHFSFDGDYTSGSIELTGGSPAGAGELPPLVDDSPTGAAGDQSASFDGTAGGIGYWNDANGLLNFDDQDYTLEAWVKIGSPNAAGTGNGKGMILGYGIPGGYSMWINNAGLLGGTTYGIVDLLTDATVPADGWHHVAQVHQIGTEVRFYIDGVLADTLAETRGVNPTTDNNLYVGYERGSAAPLNPFNGLIDRVRITGSALTPEEFDLAGVVSRPTLKISLVDGNVVVEFTGVLQSALDPEGPWQDVADQSQSPLVITPDSQLMQQYGRARLP